MKLMMATLFFCTLVVTACSTRRGHVPKSFKPMVLLIHGSFVDGASWDLLKNELEESGFQVLSPSLPGRPEFRNVTLDEMVISACDSMSSNEKAMIVGHSQGGAVITQMLNHCPERIQTLVYLAAVVPLSGETPFQSLRKKDEKHFSKAVRYLDDRVEFRSRDQLLKNFEADIDLKKIDFQVYPEPAHPVGEALFYDTMLFSKVPKFYIHTLKDYVISYASQKDYVKRTRFVRTFKVSSGHLPMVMKPQYLAKIIETISQEI